MTRRESLALMVCKVTKILSTNSKHVRDMHQSTESASKMNTMDKKGTRDRDFDIMSAAPSSATTSMVDRRIVPATRGL